VDSTDGCTGDIYEPLPMKMLAGAGAALPFAPAWKGDGVALGSERSCTLTGRWRRRDSVKKRACVLSDAAAPDTQTVAHLITPRLGLLSGLGCDARCANASEREVDELVLAFRHEHANAKCTAILDSLDDAWRLF
jgi:hypothetical protein